MSEQQERSNQVPAVMGKLVEHQRLLAILSVPQLQWVFQNPKEAMRLFGNAVILHLLEQKQEQEVVEKLLEPVGAPFKVSARGVFIVAENFVVDVSENARVRISFRSEHFEKWVLPKVERILGGRELQLHALRGESFDPDIITELGDKHRTTLHGFYETLAHKQARGDLSWIVCYVIDANGDRRTVFASWRNGWSISVRLANDISPWNAGGEFISG